MCRCRSQCSGLSGKLRLERVNTGAGAERKHVPAACNQSRARLTLESSISYVDGAKIVQSCSATWRLCGMHRMAFLFSVAQQDSCHSQELLSSAKQQASSKSACSTCRSLLPRQIARLQRYTKIGCVQFSTVTASKGSRLLYPADNRFLTLSS